MRAITYERFGGPDVLRCEELPKPEPGKNHVLVKVEAASVNPLDWHMLRGKPLVMRMSPDVRGWTPKRPGRDLAGTIEAVGEDVTGFAAGDQVFGAAQGAFADYVCAPETAFVHKPASVSFEAAAATPIAGLTALQALRDSGRLRSGGTVLINGAAGGVGSFAVQIAKALGARVTAVCGAGSAPLVRRLGADAAIDYRSEDFTRRAERYDVIVDLIGNHSYRRLKRLLAPGGRVAAVGGGAGGAYSLGGWLVRTGAAAAVSTLTRRKVVLTMSRLDLEDLAWLGALIASGKLKPVIDSRFPLAEVPDAMRHLAEGHAHGKVVIIV
ncbi:MAG TPA: NAD(P)-dependent alcohol dehydrogenase [Allosphingosinicella sp.]|nr:NAD(P)-dependent alcohol dehydrogenase [Allosphingosinicella sp.]